MWCFAAFPLKTNRLLNSSSYWRWASTSEKSLKLRVPLEETFVLQSGALGSPENKNRSHIFSCFTWIWSTVVGGHHVIAGTAANTVYITKTTVYRSCSLTVYRSLYMMCNVGWGFVDFLGLRWTRRCGVYSLVVLHFDWFRAVNCWFYLRFVHVQLHFVWIQS